MAIERPRGILSKADRRYLENPDEYSDQAAYERRQAIIERTHEALHDFSLLVHGLAEDDRHEAFEDRDLAGKDHTLNVLPSAFAFLYLGITDTVEPEDLAKDAVEDIAASGVRQALLQRGVSVEEVDVDIDVTLGEPLDELEESDELSYPEVNQLLESGRLSNLSGDKKLALLQESIESGSPEKVGAYPNLSVPTDTEEEDDESNDMPTDGDMYAPTDEFEE